MQKLGQLMNLEAFARCRLLTDAAFSLERSIQGITIIEAPDIASWIEPGTMLLTSFYGVHDDREKQKKLIGELARAKAGALVIKVDRYVKKVDSEVVAYANEVKLPLLQLEGDVPYVELMVPVMGALFNEQVYRLNYFKLCHERFMELCLAHKGLEDVVVTLTELIGKDVVLLSERGDQLVASSAESRDPEEASYYEDIEVSGVYQGRLLLFDVDELGELDRIAVDNALVSLILIMSRQLAIKEAEFRSKGEFMNDLLYGRHASIQELEEKSFFYGWRLELPTSVIALGGLYEEHERILEADLHDLLFYFRAHGLVEIHTNKSGRSIFFVQEKQQEGKLLEKIKAAAQSYFSVAAHVEHGLSLGVGRIAEESSVIRRSFKEAMDALDLIEKKLVDKKLVIFDELGIYKLLGRYDKRGELQDYIPESLLLLHKHDQTTGEDLTGTLACYLEQNMNAVRASEELFLHYKTVHYRLGKIKQIAGLDFENREQILEIEIGLKILRMMGDK